MDNEIKKYLFDINNAVSSIEDYLGDKYDKIDDGIIWGAIVRHLPILKKEVSALLDSE